MKTTIAQERLYFKPWLSRAVCCCWLPETTNAFPVKGLIPSPSHQTSLHTYQLHCTGDTGSTRGLRGRDVFRWCTTVRSHSFLLIEDCVCLGSIQCQSLEKQKTDFRMKPVCQAAGPRCSGSPPGNTTCWWEKGWVGWTNTWSPLSCLTGTSYST